MGQKNTKAKRKQAINQSKLYIKSLEEKIEELNNDTSVSQFSELPISEGTLKGLQEAGFVSLTDIQKKSIGLALKGQDILGAARTGSGKTLAFLVPVIEKLFRQSWNEYDGLGALIISPTRELAMQIYDVTTKIGKYNNFSCGLVIGGKDLKFEKERIAKMNILIGTPGRILQHMDQTAGFDLSNLQMLVLDEADRILDMGFRKSVDSILENLPPTRQSLLYSATQTKSVNDLARLSLINPQYIDTEPLGEKSSPDSLQENYIVVALPDKLDVLWSFIKTHLKCKIIVFFASSKEVHFVYETFRKMQPGISLLKLHGRQKQTLRIETTYKFAKANHVCLLATDIVARGLDFPEVNWVVQVDCPEDGDTYLHRAGRSARFGKEGNSLLMLTEAEEDYFLDVLKKTKNIEPKRLNIKPNKKKSIKAKLQAHCFSDPDLKYLGQKAFISYFKSVYLQKKIDINDLPAEEYAKSLGLPGAPKIKLKGNGSASKELKNTLRQLLKLSKANKEGDVEEKKKDRTKYDRMFERQNQNVLSEHFQKVTNGAEEEDDDDFMKVKRTDHALVEEELPDLTVPASKRQLKKSLSRKASLANQGNATKLKFDDDGVAHPIYELEDEEDFRKRGDAKQQIEQFVTKEKKHLELVDVEDKQVAKEKRQEKKRRHKELAKEEEERDDSDEEVQYVIGDVDLDRDMESSSDEEEPEPKKPKWFQKEVASENEDDDINVIEYDEPETLEDLEALTSKLIEK